MEMNVSSMNLNFFEFLIIKYTCKFSEEYSYQVQLRYNKKGMHPTTQIIMLCSHSAILFHQLCTKDANYQMAENKSVFCLFFIGMPVLTTLIAISKPSVSFSKIL